MILISILLQHAAWEQLAVLVPCEILCVSVTTRCTMWQQMTENRVCWVGILSDVKFLLSAPDQFLKTKRTIKSFTLFNCSSVLES